MKIYEYNFEEERRCIPAKLRRRDKLTKVNIEGKQHFTQPPARYTEASLLNFLKKRALKTKYLCSNHSNIITDYVVREKKILKQQSLEL